VESNTENSASLASPIRKRPLRSTATCDNIPTTCSPGPSRPPMVTTVSRVMTQSPQVTSPDTTSGSWANRYTAVACAAPRARSKVRGRFMLRVSAEDFGGRSGDVDAHPIAGRATIHSRQVRVPYAGE